MSIDDSSFGDVLDHHLGASIKLSGDGQLSFVDDNHLLVILSRRIVDLVQIATSIGLISDHADCNVRQNIFFTVFKVADFPEA